MQHFKSFFRTFEVQFAGEEVFLLNAAFPMAALDLISPAEN
jgi:hypothetical protein